MIARQDRWNPPAGQDGSPGHGTLAAAGVVEPPPVPDGSAGKAAADDLARLRIDRSPPPRKRRRWGLLLVLAVLLVAAGVAAAWFWSAQAPEVHVAEVRVRGGADGGGGGLTANGYVEARRQAAVAPQVPGRLAELSVDEGDTVRAGQVVARLDSAAADAALQQAQAQVADADAQAAQARATLVKAQADLERANRLSGSGIVSAQDLTNARTARQVAAAQLEAAQAGQAAARAGVARAQAGVEQTLVRAPFAGTVLHKDAEVGEMVGYTLGAGQTAGSVVTIADLATLEVAADVNEQYIAEVRVGQRAQITLDAYPSVAFPGHVRLIAPTADRQKGTVLVRVALDTRDRRIVPEMSARVVFSARQAGRPAPRRVIVPAGAVWNDGGQDAVWVVADGRVERRRIDAGPVAGGQREVRSGLQGGEQVVLQPPPGLQEGERVRVAPAP